MTNEELQNDDLNSSESNAFDKEKELQSVKQALRLEREKSRGYKEQLEGLSSKEETPQTKDEPKTSNPTPPTADIDSLVNQKFLEAQLNQELNQKYTDPEMRKRVAEKIKTSFTHIPDNLEERRAYMDAAERLVVVPAKSNNPNTVEVANYMAGGSSQGGVGASQATEENPYEGLTEKEIQRRKFFENEAAKQKRKPWTPPKV